MHVGSSEQGCCILLYLRVVNGTFMSISSIVHYASAAEPHGIVRA
jgi:hypothetical protein